MASQPPQPEDPSSSAFRDALLMGCSQLEAGRCHSAELDGWTSFCASQIQHELGASSIETEGLPGSVADGWKSLAVAATGDRDQKLSTSASTKVRIPSGHYSVAVRKVSVTNSFKRMAVAAEQIEKDKGTSLPTIPKAPIDAWMKVIYERLGNIQRYHAEHPMAPLAEDCRGNPVADGYDLAAEIPQWIRSADFTPEEVMGKYVDLLESHKGLMANLPDLPDKSPYQYVDFLEDLSKGLFTWKEEKKLSVRRKYARWMLDLEKYLRGFLERTVPLIDTESIVSEARGKFIETWSAKGGSVGWVDKPAEAALAKQEGESKPAIDLSQYASAEDLLLKVDADTLKTELSLRGLKCGGAPKDRAERLFLLKDKKLDDLPRKLFAKKTTKQDTTGAGEQRVDLARQEAVIQSLLDQVRPTIEVTIRRIERRQTQTLKERETEMENDLYGAPVEFNSKSSEAAADSDDEDDAPIYNPKNIPLDFDGKPIPYWLFKLHGLNHYYPCEICGGESYRGRRAFELHFAEQRHASAMRVLGIPNTKHFHGVTKVEDAQELWKSLQEKLKQDHFDGDNEEEYEDSHGVVLSRKKYEDLARQGLL